MKRLLISFLAVAFVASAPAVLPDTFSASAQGWGQSWSPRDARDARKEGKVVPLKEIYAMLRSEYGGYQGPTELVSTRRGAQYRINWITGDGKKVLFIIDAETGRILRTAGG